MNILRETNQKRPRTGKLDRTRKLDRKLHNWGSKKEEEELWGVEAEPFATQGRVFFPYGLWRKGGNIDVQGYFGEKNLKKMLQDVESNKEGANSIAQLKIVHWHVTINQN